MITGARMTAGGNLHLVLWGVMKMNCLSCWRSESSRSRSIEMRRLCISLCIQKRIEIIILNKYHVFRTQEYIPCRRQTRPGTWRATPLFPRETEESRRWKRSVLLLTETACRSRCRSPVQEASPEHNHLTYRAKHVMCMIKYSIYALWYADFNIRYCYVVILELQTKIKLIYRK